MKWNLGENYIMLYYEIKELNEEVRYYWSRLTSPRSTMEERRNQNTSDIVGDGVAKVIDMETELNQKIEALKTMRVLIEEIIDEYPSLERRLLRMRYIRRFTWLQISNRLYCDESTCRRIHRRLVKALEKK